MDIMDALCYHKSGRTISGPRFTIPILNITERSHEKILKDSVEAYTNRQNTTNKKMYIVRGCKEPSPLHNLLYFDVVKGIRPDPMHSIMLGNAKHHTCILENNVGKPYCIGSEIRLGVISSRLMSIRLLSSLMRIPRTLKTMNLWKAKEWHSWLLFYAVICMQGVIPKEYIIHFSMLSSALHILLKKSISADELHKAHILLLRYIFLYQQYFGKTAMVYNVYLLIHAKRSIECLGPAWTHTAFGFEGYNKYLLQLKKGESSVAQEITRKYLIFRALPILCDKYAATHNTIEF